MLLAIEIQTSSIGVEALVLLALHTIARDSLAAILGLLGQELWMSVVCIETLDLALDCLIDMFWLATK